MTDFLEGFRAAMKIEIDHWNAALWNTAFQHEYAREHWASEGNDPRWDRTEQSADFWKWAHFERAQIIRLTAGMP